MSFDYDAIRARKQSAGTQWASYSDLFMVLAFIFLLMYMVSSLRTGLVSITSHVKVEKMQNQLELYESITNQYLAEEASAEEKKVYQEVLGQLTLLETKATEERDQLERKLHDQKERASSLNQYQQMIVAMMNANTAAKADAAKIIDSEKQQKRRLAEIIEQANHELTSLEQELQQGKTETSALKEVHTNEVDVLENRLSVERTEIAALKTAYSKEKTDLESKYQRLSEEYSQDQNKLSSLETALTSEVVNKFALKNNHVEETKNLENRYKEMLSALQAKLQNEEARKEALEESYSQETQSLEGKYQKLQNEYESDKERLASLESALTSEVVKKLALNNAHAEETQSLQKKYQQLQDGYQRDQKKLSSLDATLKMEEAEKAALKSTHAEETKGLENKYQQIQGDYDKSLGQLASLEEKLAQGEADKALLKDEHSGERKRLQGELEQLRGQQVAGQENLALLKGKLEQQQTDMAAAKGAQLEETKGLSDKYDNLQSEYEKSLGELAALHKAVADGEGKIAVLKGKHAGELADSENKYSGLKDKYDGEIDELQSNLADAEEKLKSTADDLGRTQAKLIGTSQDLDKALELAKRRKDLAKRIQDNFKDHGINAAVDGNTGDVILDFGKEYFDYDSHELKTGMERTIRKAIPVYAQSLFGNASQSTLISSVEIIGFASPTYAGKPVNPTGLSAENRTAVNYNLDLSYKRARSIFEYIFDTDRIEFNHQDTMVHLVNVTGRSFFAEKVDPKTAGGLSIDQFCAQYDCEKSQRVIIKFGLSEQGTS